MDLIFDVSAITSEKDEFSDSKSDILKFLKIIGVDTRFISYTPQKIYINNLRFSKFSKKRQLTFNKHYPNIEIVRNSLFQKICLKSSKNLSDIKPNSRILVKDDNYIIDLLLEPYTRKYGVKLVNSDEYDLKVNPIILDDEVNNIFEGIFKGEGLKYRECENEIYPLKNVSLEWINSFLIMDNQKPLKAQNIDKTSNAFSEFLNDITPQYRENVLKASKFISSKIK